MAKGINIANNHHNYLPSKTGLPVFKRGPVLGKNEAHWEFLLRLPAGLHAQEYSKPSTREDSLSRYIPSLLEEIHMLMVVPMEKVIGSMP